MNPAKGELQERVGLLLLCSIERLEPGHANPSGLVLRVRPLDTDIDEGTQCTKDPVNQLHNLNNWNVSFGFKSNHGGGVNFVFGDGSVHFISQDINHQTYQYLGCRNDGQAFGDY